MMQKLRKIWIRQLKQHTEFGPSMVLQGDWQVLYLENWLFPVVLRLFM